jgi:DNA-binding transcriptional regulator/RsmH inhibitor MraZ
MLIPGELINHADIEKEVMLSSQLHILQLWNHGKYKNQTSELPEDFDEITKIALNTKNG